MSLHEVIRQALRFIAQVVNSGYGEHPFQLYPTTRERLAEAFSDPILQVLIRTIGKRKDRDETGWLLLTQYVAEHASCSTNEFLDRYNECALSADEVDLYNFMEQRIRTLVSQLRDDEYMFGNPSFLEDGEPWFPASGEEPWIIYVSEAFKRFMIIHDTAVAGFHDRTSVGDCILKRLNEIEQ